MPLPYPIQAPAGYVPQQAMAFAAIDGNAVAVTAATPLPTAALVAPASSTPLAAQTAASTLAGPFVPQLGRPIWLSLSGSWSGTVQLQRSVDGGTTRLPLSYPDGSARPAFTGAVNAPVAEETVAAATYHLDIVLTAGTLSYRMEQ